MKKLLITELFIPALAISSFAASTADIQPQLEQLANGGWIQQTLALEQLVDSGSRSAITPIDQLVKNQAASSYIRGRALVALARIDGGRAIGDAQVFAASPDALLRAAAAEAYGYCNGNAAKAPLGNLLKDKDGKVAIAAVVSWARLYGKDAWAVVDSVTASVFPDRTKAPHIIDKFRGENRWKIVPVMQALAYTGTADAHKRINAITPQYLEPSLYGLVRSGEIDVLPLAARHVNRWLYVKGEHTRRSLGKGPAVPGKAEYRHVMKAIQAQGPETVKKIVRTLLDFGEEQDLVLACTMAAHIIPAPETGNMLLKACGDADNANVDHACVQALTVPAMQPERYQSYFTKLLKSKHAPSRIAGIDGLAACSKVNRFEAYSEIMHGEDSNEVLQIALEQLMSAPVEQAQGQKIGTYLYKAMSSKEHDTRHSASKLFKKIAAKRDYAEVATAWESLLYSKDNQVRSLARRTIASIASEKDQVKLAREDGYITQWQVIGTFIGGKTLEKTPAYPPETELDFSKSYQADGIFVTRIRNRPDKRDKRTRTIAWQKGNVTTIDGLLHLSHFVYPPTKEAVAYVAATITPKTAGEAIIQIKGLEHDKRPLSSLWLNGDQAAAPKQARLDGYLWPQRWIHLPYAQANYKVMLKEGPNQILIKTVNTEVNVWGLRVRVLNEDGEPMEVE